MWVLPSVFFWKIVKEHDMVVPHVPRLVWIVPGVAWGSSPPLLVIVFCIVSILMCVASTRLGASRKLTTFVWLSTALIGAVHLLWGAVLLQVVRG
jgi:hypothetical protein